MCDSFVQVYIPISLEISLLFLKKATHICCPQAGFQRVLRFLPNPE